MSVGPSQAFPWTIGGSSWSRRSCTCAACAALLHAPPPATATLRDGERPLGGPAREIGCGLVLHLIRCALADAGPPEGEAAASVEDDTGHRSGAQHRRGVGVPAFAQRDATLGSCHVFSSCRICVDRWPASKTRPPRCSLTAAGVWSAKRRAIAATSPSPVAEPDKARLRLQYRLYCRWRQASAVLSPLPANPVSRQDREIA